MSAPLFLGLGSPEHLHLIAAADHHHVGHADEQARLDHAGYRCQRRGEAFGSLDAPEGAIEDEMAVDGDVGGAVAAAQDGLAAELLYGAPDHRKRSEEHTSELQSLMRNSYAVFCLKKNTHN